MKILVTAGPTREAIDPVRFLSNRSTGKMGYAVAEVAASSGHEVRLISGPVALVPPEGIAVTSVISAADMLKAVLAHFKWCDALIMSAAVADWRPVSVATEKLKKTEMSAALELERTQDILEAVKRLKHNQLVVGFAAETQNLIEEAQRKLSTKGLDLIVANDVSRPDAGFEVDTNAVTLVSPEGISVLPLMSKRSVAEALIQRLEKAQG
jgi:phosphopantothenoylcysteine decarboxylase/phosphopantothenate--cysteine ligase